MYQPEGFFIYSAVAGTIFVAAELLPHVPPTASESLTPPSSHAQICGTLADFTKTIVLPPRFEASTYPTETFVVFPDVTGICFSAATFPVPSNTRTFQLPGQAAKSKSSEGAETFLSLEAISVTCTV